MSYQEKYLKYKTKYTHLLMNKFNGVFYNDGKKLIQMILPNTKLFIKKHTILNNLIGGVHERFQTVPNNGYYNEKFSNQCFWLSVHEYLKRFLGHEGNIIDLRKTFGLNEDSDHNMFDTFNNRHMRAAKKMAEHFNIRINLYAVTGEGEPRDLKIIDGRRYAMPREIINPRGEMIVDIAWSGGHFELIMNGPDRIQKNQKYEEIRKPDNVLNLDDTFNQNYNVKVYFMDDHLYKPPEGLAEKEMMYYTLQLDLIDTNDKIYALTQQSHNIPINLEAHRKTLENIHSLGLNAEEKQTMIDELVLNISIMESELESSGKGLVELEKLRDYITMKLMTF